MTRLVNFVGLALFVAGGYGLIKGYDQPSVLQSLCAGLCLLSVPADYALSLSRALGWSVIAAALLAMAWYPLGWVTLALFAAVAGGMHLAGLASDGSGDGWSGGDTGGGDCGD